MTTAIRATYAHSSGDIARRLAAGTLTLRRAEIDLAYQTGRVKNDSNLQKSLDEIQARAQTLRDAFTPQELALAQADLGAVGLPTLARFMDRGEALGVLGWSLSRVPHWPPFDLQFLVSEQPRVGDVLRSSEELTHTVLATELWDWRARARPYEEMRDRHRTVTRKNDRAIADHIGIGIYATVQYARAHGVLPPGSCTDFGIGGGGQENERPYASATKQEALVMYRIAKQRLAAFGWLVADRDWDTPLERVEPVLAGSSSCWYYIPRDSTL
ncbi:hypothetical protein BC828DRAFT_374950 [Blastocladiella britannica]|nr:hypothetical protein BC828DRAFT_374950 [Blastocladiella britannica]